MAERTWLLLRHGIAEERIVPPPEDPDQARALDAARRLTERGRQRTEAVLRQLLAAGLLGDQLLSSPLVRAHETAALAVAVGLAPSLELAPSLAPGGDPLPLLQRPARRLILVGHEPDLSALACRLIGAPAGSLVLRKAGSILLSLDPAAGASSPLPCARLRLLLRPRALLA
ncbi:MAG: SixA phosphatase family protein [Cyanobacteriota bacterium]